MLWTVAWWRGAGERALKTFAQSLLAGFIITVPIANQPWLLAVGTALTATLFSLFTSIGNADFTAVSPEPGSTDGVTPE